MKILLREISKLALSFVVFFSTLQVIFLSCAECIQIAVTRKKANILT